MTAYETVLQEATQLSVEQRVQLIDALWETVPEESFPPLSQEWLDEIERRTAEYDAGLVESFPWEVVRDEARKRVGLPPIENVTSPDTAPASLPPRR